MEKLLSELMVRLNRIPAERWEKRDKDYVAKTEYGVEVKICKENEHFISPEYGPTYLDRLDIVVYINGHPVATETDWGTNFPSLREFTNRIDRGLDQRELEKKRNLVDLL